MPCGCTHAHALLSHLVRYVISYNVCTPGHCPLPAVIVHGLPSLQEELEATKAALAAAVTARKADIETLNKHKDALLEVVQAQALASATEAKQAQEDLALARKGLEPFLVGLEQDNARLRSALTGSLQQLTEAAFPALPEGMKVSCSLSCVLVLATIRLFGRSAHMYITRLHVCIMHLHAYNHITHLPHAGARVHIFAQRCIKCYTVVGHTPGAARSYIHML